MRLDEMIHSKSLQTSRYIATMPNGDQVQLWKQRAEVCSPSLLHRARVPRSYGLTVVGAPP